MKRLILGLMVICMTAFTFSAQADEKPEFILVIKDHKFQPDVLEVPANQKVVIIVDNQDPTPEEFESHELRREKIIPGNTKAKIFVGPLEPGEYPFFGEFNEATCQGKLIVK